MANASAPASTNARTPVSVLTGFLGSGKTTLLNAWLRHPDLSDAAVIVNEFGAIGIDHDLIEASSDQTIRLSTGCLCCTVQGDLVETLRKLTLARADGTVPDFKRVLIETTGMADPVPVLQALMAHPVAASYRLAKVITAVDAFNGPDTLRQHEEARRQVSVADVLVLTKTDLVTADAQAALWVSLSELNPAAGQHMSTPAKMPPASLLDADDIYDPQTRAAAVADWLRPAGVLALDGRMQQRGGHRHDGVLTFCIEIDEPIAWEHAAAWLDALVIAHGQDLLRVKGLLNIRGRARPIVLQAVQKLFHPPAELAAWPDDDHRSRIVFITRNLRRDYVSQVLDVIRGKPHHSADRHEMSAALH